MNFEANAPTITTTSKRKKKSINLEDYVSGCCQQPATKLVENNEGYILRGHICSACGKKTWLKKK